MNKLFGIKKFILILSIILILVSSLLITGVSDEQNFDFNTRYVFELDRDGSTIFSIENRVPLENEEEENEFDAFLNNFSRDREEELNVFINDTKPIVEQASIETGREMSAEEYHVSAEKIETITDTYGLVEYSFKWINFSLTREKEIIVGDVFVGGLRLGEGDELVIDAPENYSIEGYEPEVDEVDDGVLTWSGSIDFDAGEPEVSFSLNEDSTNDSNNDTDPGGGGDDNSLLIIYIGLGAAISVALIVFFLKRRDTTRFSGAEEDEKVILDILRENGGEMYQNELVKETSFSKAKVSNLLKSMNEKELIEKIQKGRRNLIRIN